MNDRYPPRWTEAFLVIAVLLAAVLPLPASDGAGGRTEHAVEGFASWYGGRFHGRTTASGEIFDTNALTAAHRTLAFDTVVRVVNLKNGRSVVVRINDRGPFVDGRIIDLSRAAAAAIDMINDGIAAVRLEIVHLEQESELRTIQIASFSVSANAESLASRLRASGISAQIETTHDRRLFRVVVRSVSVAELYSLVERLARLGHPNVLVRTE